MSRRVVVMDRALADMQGQAWRSTSRALSAVDRLETREQIDRRSDAFFEAVLAGMVALARRYPALLCEVAPLVAEQQRGIVTDSLEDEHCTAASTDAADAAEASREISATCEQHLSVGGEASHVA